MAKVEKVREGMARGDYYEVVLRQTFQAPYEAKASQLFLRMQEGSPSPYEFLIATGRLLGRMPEDPGRFLGGLNLLGQPLWSPAGPNGFADTNAAWAAPEGLKLRLDISAQVASKLPDTMTTGSRRVLACWAS